MHSRAESRHDSHWKQFAWNASCAQVQPSSTPIFSCYQRCSKPESRRCLLKSDKWSLQFHRVKLILDQTKTNNSTTKILIYPILLFIVMDSLLPEDKSNNGPQVFKSDIHFIGLKHLWAWSTFYKVDTENLILIIAINMWCCSNSPLQKKCLSVSFVLNLHWFSFCWNNSSESSCRQHRKSVFGRDELNFYVTLERKTAKKKNKTFLLPALFMDSDKIVSMLNKGPHLKIPRINQFVYWNAKKLASSRVSISFCAFTTIRFTLLSLRISTTS